MHTGIHTELRCVLKPALLFVCEKVETPPPSLTSRASGNGSVGKGKEEVSRRRHLLCSCMKHSLSGSACSGTEEFLSLRQEPTEPLHGGHPGVILQAVMWKNQPLSSPHTQCACSFPAVSADKEADKM